MAVFSTPVASPRACWAQPATMGKRIPLVSPRQSLRPPFDGSIPITERLERDYFTLHRLDWRNAVNEPGGIEFNLPLSAWFRLFRDTGFDVVNFIEIQAPASTPEEANKVRFFVTNEWAHRYPAEQVWVLHKR
jgi:hypothetical protein